MRILGAVIAGGMSTRYGSPKALAPIAGERVVDRVLRAVREVCDGVIVIANDPQVGDAIGVEWHSDDTAGLGPIAGIDAALAVAEARGYDGIIAVACDMPFLSAPLLRVIIDGASKGDADAVLPESRGPRGLEPLVAFYATSCRAAIAAAAQREDHRLIGFHRDIRVARIPLAVVEAFGDPATLFMNMNAPADRDRAEAILRTANGNSTA